MITLYIKKDVLDVDKTFNSGQTVTWKKIKGYWLGLFVTTQ